MTLQEFLQSGLLESYILGHCDQAERVQVEQMLEKHPEARTELNAIESALEQYAQARSIPAPPWMKGKIIDAIEQSSKPSRIQKPSKSAFGPLHWLLSTAFAGALVFAVVNVKQNNDLQQEKEQVGLQLQQCNDAKTKNDRLQAFLLHPETKSVKINWIDTTKTALNGLAIAYDNRTLNEDFVQILDMPELPSNQDYQFWIIRKGEPNPVPYNVFQFNSGIINMSNRDEVVAFAVSIEPKGGSSNGKPTQVIMLGKV